MIQESKIVSGGRIFQQNRAVVALLALAVLTRHSESAWAGLVGVQAQMQYNFAQVKQRGGPTIGNGHLSTNYNLTMRRPFLPSSTLITDLSINSTRTDDSSSSQTTRGWTLNMYSDQARYSLIGRLSRNDFGTSSGEFASSTGQTTDYNVGLLLREPAYPVANIQFRRNISGSSFAGTTSSYTSTTMLMSSYYDMLPFRFTIDRMQQTLAYSGAPGIRTSSQSSAITLNHTLLPGLTLSGDVSKTSSNVAFPSGSTSTNTARRLIRLSATPTRTTVADVELQSQSNEQVFGGLTRINDDRSIMWSMRSEIVPGLSLDYSDQRQSQAGNIFVGTGGSNSMNRNISLSARLSEATILNITSARSNYNFADGQSSTKQDSIQSTLQTSLTRSTDFSLNYGSSKSETGLGDSYESVFTGFSLRDRTSAKLSIGTTYRHTAVRSRVAVGGSFDQSGDDMDLDMLWQPRYDMGVNLRLSYQNNTGTTATKAVSPSANLRWELDSSSSLTANYTLQSFRQSDATNTSPFALNTTGLTLRLTHNFATGSYLDLSYDFQGNSTGQLEWRKQIGASYTMSF